MYVSVFLCSNTKSFTTKLFFSECTTTVYDAAELYVNTLVYGTVALQELIVALKLYGTSEFSGAGQLCGTRRYGSYTVLIETLFL